MATQGNENVTNLLTQYISDNGGDSSALAASLLLNCAADMSKESWAAVKESGGQIQQTPFTLQSVLKRHKFASSQLMKFHDMTYALQVKLLQTGKTGKDDKAWVLVGDELVQMSVKEMEDRDLKDSKINKNDLNSIRSFYDEQLTKELPKLLHKIYNEFISLKSSYSYNANEVRLVLMDRDFLRVALSDVQKYIGGEVFAEDEKAQREFLYDAWFKYTKATGKSTEKVGDFFKKLLNSTMSRLAKAIAVYRKEGSSKAPSRDEAEQIMEVYQRYVPLSQDEKAANKATDAELLSYLAKASCDSLHGKMKLQFDNGVHGTDLSSRVAVVCDLRDLAMNTFVNCNASLVHLETISNLQRTHKNVRDIKSHLSVVTRQRFEEAIAELSAGVIPADQVPESYNDAFVVPTEDGALSFAYPVGSERLNTAIFKAIGAHSQVSNHGKEKTSRKKFSRDLERTIVTGDNFQGKILEINRKKASNGSNRSKKQRDEHSLIISTELYESLEDGDLKRSFDDAHSDDSYGLVQKGTMFLSSASKIHDENAAVMAAAEASGIDYFDQVVGYRLFADINDISLVVSVYAGLTSGKTVKEEKPAASGVDMSKLRKPAVKPTTAASASPKTGGRTIGKPTDKPASGGMSLKERLAAKKPAAQAEEEVVEDHKHSTASPGMQKKGTSSQSSSPAKTGSASPGLEKKAAGGTKLMSLLNRAKKNNA